MDRSYFDQDLFFNPDEFGWDVHVIGAGSIGSNLLVMLAKMGIITKIHFWDDDDVEVHNLNTQAFRLSDVGRPKVEAMADILAGYADGRATLVPHSERVTSATPLSGLVLSGVDSMSARHAIWEAVKASAVDVPYYVDGRIAGEYFKVLALSPYDFDRLELYESTYMYDDEQVEPAPCGASKIIYPMMMCASVMTSLLKTYASGNIDDIPFSVDVNSSTFQLVLS